MVKAQSSRGFTLVAPFAGAWIEIYAPKGKWSRNAVAPFAGAWIEIAEQLIVYRQPNVAPFAGAWIEIFCCLLYSVIMPSLPSRERGLKYPPKSEYINNHPVAPFAGAWIEILQCLCLGCRKRVAPFAGAWIEMAGLRQAGG